MTEFHTLLETLDKEMLGDVFVRLPIDMDRWLMEGSYLKIYRAKDRVPREEFQYLLQQLWTTMRWVSFPAPSATSGIGCMPLTSGRSQIAETIQTSYFSIPIQSAARLIYFTDSNDQIMKELVAVSSLFVQASLGLLRYHD